MKRAFLLTILSLSALACTEAGAGGGADGGDGALACGSGTSPSLTVNVTGLPPGVDARVTIDGPGGTRTATATTTLTDLAAGDYTITAAMVTSPDPIVRKAYQPTVVTGRATIACGGPAAAQTVTYALVPTSNKLWWGSANSASDTLGYASSSLASTGAPDATIAATTPGAIPGAFDKEGNLWVVDGVAGSVGIERYSAEHLAFGGAKTPDVVLTSDALGGGTPGPVSLAFDPAGNLWVGVGYSSQVIELDAAHLAASGAVTPAVVIANVPSPYALAFDAKGSLWVGAGDAVVQYLAERLGASISGPPDATIAAQSAPPVTGPLSNVRGLAFTGAGDLWVDYDGTIAKIASTQLVSGTVTPGVQIRTDVLSLPEGIAFDESGGLWLAYSAGKFCKLGASQLTVSGSVVPEVVVTSGSVGSATSPAFFPAPASVPLYSSLP